jgi:hypothetical protein
MMHRAKTLTVIMLVLPLAAQAQQSTASNQGTLVQLYWLGNAVGNGADGRDAVLTSYTLPALRMASDGDRLRIDASGPLVADGNTKRVTVRFGGAVIAQVFAPGTATTWNIDTQLLRTAATDQTFNSAVTPGGPFTGTATVDLSHSVLIQICGQNEGQPSPSAPNTVVLQFLTIDLLPKQ